MTSTDEAILTFAEAFSRLGDRKHSELYVEALATLVRMAKAEERQATQNGWQDDDDDDDELRQLPDEPAHATVMH
ncbi:MAG: hypothetical protein ABWY05_05730 [Noviherbaspirillum sp.]